MSKAASPSVLRLFRAAVAALAVAVILVPAVARARQHVELRDATRLSIRHSWIGIAPPTKTLVAPRQIAIMPAAAEPPAPRLTVQRTAAVAVPAPLVSLEYSLDPLRGPPSAGLLQ